MLKLFEAVRLIVWLPFKIVTIPIIVMPGVFYLTYLSPSSFIFIFILAAVMRKVASFFERLLRPARRVAMPGRGKPLIAALVRASQKLRYRAPGRSAFTRSLSPQLKKLLKQPATQKPAAVRFEEAKIAGYQAERETAS